MIIMIILKIKLDQVKVIILKSMILINLSNNQNPSQIKSQIPIKILNLEI